LNFSDKHSASPLLPLRNSQLASTPKRSILRRRRRRQQQQQHRGRGHANPHAHLRVASCTPSLARQCAIAARSEFGMGAKNIGQWQKSRCEPHRRKNVSLRLRCGAPLVAKWSQAMSAGPYVGMQPFYKSIAFATPVEWTLILPVYIRSRIWCFVAGKGTGGYYCGWHRRENTVAFRNERKMSQFGA
jgi:hypothetical protein